jgi:retron-type reverse transcriptase
VQQACLMLLNPVFEPTFSSLSHGFIKRRSCHSALLQMDKKMRYTCLIYWRWYC